MDTPRIQIPPHLRQQNLQLLIAPFQYIHVQPETKPLYTLTDRDMIIRSHKLEIRVLGPWPDGKLVHFYHDVREASVTHPSLEFWAGTGLTAEQSPGLRQRLGPGFHRCIFKAAVVASDYQVEVCEFDEAAGCGVSRVT